MWVCSGRWATLWFLKQSTETTKVLWSLLFKRNDSRNFCYCFFLYSCSFQYGIYFSSGQEKFRTERYMPYFPCFFASLPTMCSNPRRNLGLGLCHSPWQKNLLGINDNGIASQAAAPLDTVTWVAGPIVLYCLASLTISSWYSTVATLYSTVATLRSPVCYSWTQTG